MYPEIEPYESGMIDVGDGHRVYWEVCGNPRGKPAVVVHGGPGSGCSVGMRRFFDPAAYRTVLFDQRMSGRSTPHASEPGADFTANTTEHLLADMEQLREYLGIDRWLVHGGSWGSVLGLLYAERHPHRVTEMVLCGLATGRRAETDLLTRGLGEVFPEAWARFRAGIPEADRDGDFADAYHRLLMHPDPAVRNKAARDWCEWEDAIVPTSPSPSPRFQDPAFALGFARIVTHFWRRGSWLEEGVVLAEAGRLAGIPGVLVQGNLDLGNLIGTPWQLAAAWPGSELVLVDAGHHATGALGAAIVGATDRFRG
ncbi:prolyl aminopeptidase [Saccharopolyspora erythraea]|uniref:prolyl aminopeptidase n=1 Tax=Saccharopolyspora erythraea TaxID=1836 RepID=UPI001BABC132|nr:prolyl aminopeptidase [Saccharopolyspora erythraea]QUH00611.1 prolyl aminopeptidase [Saccharopolyspora erythraea]